MVEEADVVVLLFERPNLVLDELVEHGQIIGDVLRDIEIHDALSSWAVASVAISFPPSRLPH